MEKIRKILETETEVMFAYLFGSYAKGTQDKRSDIDIAVYIRDAGLLERDVFYPSRLAIKIERELEEKKPVDVRVLNGSTLRFRSQVIRYGRLLYSRNEKERIDFETSSLACYYDFKPFLEAYDAARKVRLGI